jgi:peptidoglycan DL-endopeptidase LytF
MSHGWRAELKRYGAPVAFLAAVTVAVLLVRSGLETKSAPVTTTIATTASTQTGTTPGGRHRPRFYRLRGGETLSDVALRFNTTVDTLMALNPHIKPYALRVGQRIRVR